LVSPKTRGVASEAKATKRPSALRLDAMLALFPETPVLATRTRKGEASVRGSGCQEPARG
jgi:hypothetical protein